MLGFFTTFEIKHLYIQLDVQQIFQQDFKNLNIFLHVS